MKVPLEMSALTKMSALDSVARDDAVSLRMICTLSHNRSSNIEELDQYGNTALLKACYLGKFECARILLDFGANIHAINYCGQNALTLATYAGNLRLVLELLRHRTYEDFNKSSLMPAVCVAMLRHHRAIFDYFLRIDPSGIEDIQTVHGLCVSDLRQMVNERLRKSLNSF